MRPQQHLDLKIEASGPIVRKWLVPRLNHFCGLYPELEVAINTKNDGEAINLDDSDVSIILSYTPPKGVFAKHICDEVLLPLASPKLINKLDLRKPADMARAPLLHDTSFELFDGMPGWSQWYTEAGLSASSVQRGMKFDPQAADHAIDAANSDIGVVLGRYFLAHDDLQNGRLHCPFGPILETQASYYVVCRLGDEVKSNIATFFLWLENEITGMKPHSHM